MLILCVGYPDEAPPKRPRWPLKAVLHENRYVMPSKKAMQEYYRKANKELVEMNYFSKGVRNWAEHWQKKFEPAGVEEWEDILRKDLRKMGFLPL